MCARARAAVAALPVTARNCARCGAVDMVAETAADRPQTVSGTDSLRLCEAVVCCLLHFLVYFLVYLLVSTNTWTGT